MNRRDVESQLAALRSELIIDDRLAGTYSCEGCTNARASTFCTDSRDIWRCTYCVRCEACTDCTRCSECVNVHESSYCERSQRCSGSSWLALCEDCVDCVYCFGCVGLKGKEFHIFNERFGRKEYFIRLAELRAAVGLPERT